MGKTSKWIRSFLGTGKKDKDKEKEKEKINASKNEQNIHQNQNGNGNSTANDHHIPTTPIAIPPTTPREKRRWSFRRSSASAPGHREFHSAEQPQTAFLEPENHDQKKHAMAMAAATAAAADAAAAAAKAAAAVIQLTAAASGRTSAIEEAAATKIQSVFRSYLARKALNALKGLVKLQALVRGHLVRKQATATLRCMQALVTAQERARIQRIQMVQESNSNSNLKQQFNHRKSTQENWSRHSYHDYENGMEENIKIVEMDIGEYSKGSTKSRHSYSNNGTPNAERMDQRILITHRAPPKPEQISPSPSARTELSPRAYSSVHFEDYPYHGTAQSSPQCQPEPGPGHTRSEYGDSLYSDYPFYPSYMANTESSRAKVRSHSAPKQRPESFERQPSATRRRPSIEGRNVPRAVKMQRSTSHVGTGAQGFQYPWSIKLDRSAISLKDSECGSTSTVMTNNNYCRSLVGFEVHGSRY